MLPPEALDSLGQNVGQSPLVRPAVPCSIDTLSGREAELARSTYPEVTHKVEMYADPNNPVTPVHYLTGGTIGTRRINVVADVAQIGGPVHTLLCIEVL